MGNKGSRGRNGLSKETVDFLVKNTKFSREMIKVAVSYKTESLLACTVYNVHGALKSFHIYTLTCLLVQWCTGSISYTDVYFCLLTSGTPVQWFRFHLFACVGVVHTGSMSSFMGLRYFGPLPPIPPPLHPPTRSVRYLAAHKTICILL